MSNNKSKSNQANPYTQTEDSIQVVDSTKKQHCSSESENPNARQSIVNFKLLNRSMHKSALEYLDMEEYIDSMDLKNRTKCAANSQFEQPGLITISKFIDNSDHNVELDEGVNLKKDEQRSSFNYIIDSNSLSNVDLSIKHIFDKVDVVDYNNNNVNECNYNELLHVSKTKVADENERIDNINSEYIFNMEAENPGILVIEHLNSQEKHTNTPDYSSNQQTQIKQQSYNHDSDNINKVEYTHIDKSESDEKHEDKIKRTQNNIIDYLHVPEYEMKKTLVKDKSKLKTYLDLLL